MSDTNNHCADCLAYPVCEIRQDLGRVVVKHMPKIIMGGAPLDAVLTSVTDGYAPHCPNHTKRPGRNGEE